MEENYAVSDPVGPNETRDVRSRVHFVLFARGRRQRSNRPVGFVCFVFNTHIYIYICFWAGYDFLFPRDRFRVTDFASCHTHTNISWSLRLFTVQAINS